MLTQHDVIALVHALGLPAIVEQIVRGERLDVPLGLVFSAPGEFFASSAAQRVNLAGEHVVPLWDTGSFQELVGYDRARSRFVRFFVEDGYDPASPGWSWQQVLLDDFVGLYELEVSDTDFGHYARLFGFRYAGDIIRAYGELDLGSYDRHRAWCEALRSRMDS